MRAMTMGIPGTIFHALALFWFVRLPCIVGPTPQIDMSCPESSVQNMNVDSSTTALITTVIFTTSLIHPVNAPWHLLAVLDFHPTTTVQCYFHQTVWLNNFHKGSKIGLYLCLYFLGTFYCG